MRILFPRWLPGKVMVMLAAVIGITGSSFADEQRVRDLETQLLAADRIQLQFSVTASGAVEASLSGFLVLRGDSEISLDANGTFAGEAVELKLATMNNELHYGRKSNPATSDIPVEIKPALLIGFVRMGILHNLARLTAGAPPDHAAGGVEEWVVLDNYVNDPDRNASGFEIFVAGQHAGSASLIFDDQGLIRREQTVEFPGGSMSVREEYTALQIR